MSSLGVPDSLGSSLIVTDPGTELGTAIDQYAPKE